MRNQGRPVKVVVIGDEARLPNRMPPLHGTFSAACMVCHLTKLTNEAQLIQDRSVLHLCYLMWSHELASSRMATSQFVFYTLELMTRQTIQIHALTTMFLISLKTNNNHINTASSQVLGRLRGFGGKT
jgi:hypothetical protein